LDISDVSSIEYSALGEMADSCWHRPHSRAARLAETYHYAHQGFSAGGRARSGTMSNHVEPSGDWDPYELIQTPGIAESIIQKRLKKAIIECRQRHIIEARASRPRRFVEVSPPNRGRRRVSTAPTGGRGRASSSWSG
jgi:hypothetical protein